MEASLAGEGALTVVGQGLVVVWTLSVTITTVLIAASTTLRHATYKLFKVILLPLHSGTSASVNI